MLTNRATRAKKAKADDKAVLSKARDRDRSLLGRVLVGVLFGLILVALVFYGKPPLDVREGERAKREIISRVDFRFKDQDEKRRVQEAAANAVPNVYTETDEELFTQLGADLKQLMQETQKVETFENFPKELANNWALGEDDFKIIKNATTREKDLLSVMEGIDNVMEAFGERELVSAQRYQLEREGKQEEIKIIRRGQVFLRRVDDLLSPEHSDDFIKEILNSTVKDAELKKLFAEYLIRRNLKATLDYNDDATKEAREEARETAARNELSYTIHIKKRSIIVNLGEEISAYQVAILEEEHRAFIGSEPPMEKLQRLGGVVIIVGALVGLCAAYISRFQHRLANSETRLVTFSIVCLLVILLAKILLHFRITLYLTPVALASIVLGIVYGQRFALVIGMLLSLAVAILLGKDYSIFVVLMFGAAASSFGVNNIRNRAKLVKLGVAVGAVQFCSIWGLGLIAGIVPLTLLRDSLMGLSNGILVGVAISVMLPFIETTFNITTDIRLLELSDQTADALRRLLLTAPGTYHHSFIVGNLAESAADAVGANSLHTRVGSYYHDIGKILKPEYFIENQGLNQSKHMNLSPAMSTLIITSHTKDGAELAKEYKLPSNIVDVIRQHHGTTRVEYFYQQALKNQGENGDVKDGVFRYAGPKPQSREAGIVMLADSVESASRTLSEPTPSRIENLVREIVNKKLMDGQLNECSLTLQEVHQIESSLVKSLMALFHSRIKYPQQEKETKKQEDEVTQ